MGSNTDLCSANSSAGNRIAVHYKCLAKNFDFFLKERLEAQFKALMKYLDVKPDHLVVDIGSGTGFLGERIFETFQMKNPVWCVEPCEEMQEVAKTKKGVLAIQKSAEEFLKDLDKQHRFDRVMCISTAHHFSDPVEIYSDVESCLTPDGVFFIVQVGEYTFPLFKKAKDRIVSFVSQRKETFSACLRSANFEVEVSEEQVDFMVRKSKWYNMLRGRFHSTLSELNEEEIEEGIDELDKGILQHVKPHDDISISIHLLIFIAKKK